MSKNLNHPYLDFSRSIPPMQYIEMVHGSQAGATRVRVDPEHVEVMAASVRRHQQHTTSVKLQSYYCFRVRYEVSHDWIECLFAVLAVVFLVTLEFLVKEKLVLISEVGL